MKPPVVSICIPAYNGSKFIGRAIDFCLAQTYPHIEVVVTDDDSKDNTREIVEAYASKDPRVKLFRNEKNLGLVRNLYHSFEMASGDYVQHLGCDDWLDPTFVEEKIKIFENYPDVAFVNCGTGAYRKHEETGEYYPIGRHALAPGRYEKDYIFKNFYKPFGLTGTSSTVRRKDALKHFMITIPNKWNYEEWYLKGKVIDQIVFLNILADYDYMYYLDNVFFNSLDHAQNASKHFGFDKKDISDNVKFVHIDAAGFEYFFREKDPQDLSRFRIFIGSDMLAGVAFDLILRRATGSPWEWLKKFFTDYTPREKTLTYFYAIIRLVRRSWDWVFRRLKPRSKE